MPQISSDNFNDSLPAAPAGYTNVKWQADPSGTSPRNISAYYATGGASAAPNSVTQYGAVGDGSTDDSSAFSAAAAAWPEGIVVPAASGTFLMGTNVTIGVPIFMEGGQIEAATGITVTLNGSVFAPASGKIFVLTGTGVVKIGTGTSSVYAEWWGAVGDGTTDDSTAIQAAITSLYGAGSTGANDGHGAVQLLAKAYSQGTTGLTISHGGVSLLGVNESITGSQVIFGSAITTTSATVTQLTLQGTSGSYILDNHVENISFKRTVQPTGTATGIILQYLYRTRMLRCYVVNHIRGFSIANMGAGGTGIIEHCNTSLSSVSGAGTYYGFYVDETGSNTTPSLKGAYNTSDKGSGSPTTIYGFYATGIHIQDILWQSYETAQLTYGVYLNSTGGAFYTNSDNVFLNNTHDGCVTSAYYITGMSSSNSSSVTILGGRVSTVGAGPGIDIETCNGVVVSNVSFASTATTTNHVKISGGSGNSINSNNFTMLFSGSTAVLLNSTSANAVDSNIVIGSSATSTTAFKLTGASNNVLIGNAVSGTLATGISFDATSNNNLAYPNELAAATTAVSDSGSGNITTSVNKLDGISGPVTLVAGTGVTITDNSPSAGNITIASTSTSADYVVMSNGANPPTPMDDGAGDFLYVGYTP